MVILFHISVSILDALLLEFHFTDLEGVVVTPPNAPVHTISIGGPGVNILAIQVRVVVE